MAASVSPRAEQSAQRLAFTYREAAQQLGVCERVIWQAVKDGHLQAARIGRSVRIPATALADYLNSRVTASVSPSTTEA